MCRQNPDNQYSDKTGVKHIDTEEQSTDYAQSEYTTPYYLTNDQVKASVKYFKTRAKIHHMHNRDTEHIRLLLVAQSQESQVSQTDCEANTGAGCNHRAQQLFGQEWIRTLDPPRVQIEAYCGKSMHSLGSCVLHLHVDNKAFPTILEVTNMTKLIILGRAQAKAMGYVEFPKIKCPHTFTTHPTTSKNICTIKTLVPETATGFPPTDSVGTTPRVHVHKSESTKATQAKQSRQTTEPVVPQIKWNTGSIELNGKMHKLLITKDYMVREYGDIFKGVETLPGGPYHIRLKEKYRPVQHPPRSVPVAMQSPYRAELNRLVKEGIITEVKEHAEWINLIVPVMKSNGSLRLCLDPKDLNKAIERNQWYSRMIDDLLPELAKSKYKTLKDATSGYWHIVLDLARSLLTTFNTPWGKFR